ncbi:hypothetical protein BCR35DRAFT_316435 [Leucosporidium creatinivorum]|uniref:SAC3/GANP/Nin1/mts3/eIF-3 p25 family-domain-containing protein n=1 Tax=Leucosporidium creatinivorum TaxID=106004 RepID=A0A1Y2C508_9BASI|nr:hypothetical protein BCR35DRAFT_316435 [Leucosporidium creatinivorum]
MATGEVGRKPGEMEMLLSPSRGVDDSDAASLKSPAVQERFRKHIADKLGKLEAAFPEKLGDAARTAKRKEELGIVLLDFRKLREGLTSIRRVDAFAAEVYEASVRTAIKAENWQQLGACLPHLVLDIHPFLADPASPSQPSPSTSETSTTPLTDSLDSLSLSPSPSPSPSPSTSAPPLSLRLYFISLYLLHLLCHHPSTSLPTFHSTLSIFPSLPPAASPPSPGSPHIALARATYHALLTSNYVLFARLLRPPSTSSSPKADGPDAYQLAILRSAVPAMREKAWLSLEKGYKMAGDFEDLAWLGRVLMFPPEEEEQLRTFLEKKGRKPPPPRVRSAWD